MISSSRLSSVLGGWLLSTLLLAAVALVATRVPAQQSTRPATPAGQTAAKAARTSAPATNPVAPTPAPAQAGAGVEATSGGAEGSPSPPNPKPAASSSDAAKPADEQVQKDHAPQILAWVNVDPDKEKSLPGGSKAAYGTLLFLLGAVGALITAFYSVGDALPGIGGDSVLQPLAAEKKAYDDGAKIVEANLSAVQEKLKTCDAQTDVRCVDSLKTVAGTYIEEMKLYDEQSSRLRVMVNNNKWRIYTYGMPMYVLIGGATAVLFARDWLQALLFGYSWASVVSTVGLKGASVKKSDVASQQAEELEKRLRQEQDQRRREKEEMKSQQETLSTMLTLALKQIPPTSR